ncbi:MAG TPA: hydroxymethylglutaryl-CoA reductase, degradative [Candidatus Thermoplasmatota archaeon]|nr:hydroxymethylglutaryl-CoA reductase, degradative [Candidatus Thermoplasmatota archaeon]
MKDPKAAPWSGFHRLHRKERLRRVAVAAGLSVADEAALSSPLAPELAESFIENALGSFPLPLGVAVNFVVDGKPVLVPMAVEESSVVAAASHGAKLAAHLGGFRTEVMDPVAIGQVELRGVRDLAAAKKTVTRSRKAWMRLLDERIPSMVKRGGGLRGIEARDLGKGRLVLHLLVDTRDAMGANVVNTLCEALAPVAAEAVGAKPGLRILSNLADHRLATATCAIPHAALGGKGAAKAIVAANRLALDDPYRAATHNKGILNGIDPLLVATGNDWRAVEAGAHAYAARTGAYRALTTYRQDAQGDLHASLTLPMPVGTVGGVTRLHPTAKACLKMLGEPDGRRLAAVCVSVGLAQNLAALKALAGEGIQRGHMALHASNLALARKRA